MKLTNRKTYFLTGVDCLKINIKQQIMIFPKNKLVFVGRNLATIFGIRTFFSSSCRCRRRLSTRPCCTRRIQRDEEKYCELFFNIYHSMLRKNKLVLKSNIYDCVTVVTRLFEHETF